MGNEIFEEIKRKYKKSNKYMLYVSYEDIGTLLNLIEKQSNEIEELKETLKCTQNSWYEDTQKIEEMKKQIDLDNECEIALNNRIMDLENELLKVEDYPKVEKLEQKSNYDEILTHIPRID